MGKYNAIHVHENWLHINPGFLEIKAESKVSSEILGSACEGCLKGGWEDGKERWSYKMGEGELHRNWVN